MRGTQQQRIETREKHSIDSAQQTGGPLEGRYRFWYHSMGGLSDRYLFGISGLCRQWAGGTKDDATTTCNRRVPQVPAPSGRRARGRRLNRRSRPLETGLDIAQGCHSEGSYTLKEPCDCRCWLAHHVYFLGCCRHGLHATVLFSSPSFLPSSMPYDHQNSRHVDCCRSLVGTYNLL